MVEDDPYLHYVEERRRRILDQLSSIISSLEQVLNMMPQDMQSDSESKTEWTEREVDALVEYLYEHRSERTDGANFKDGTFDGAVAHLEPLLMSSKAKDIQSIKHKWGQLTNTFMTICTWRDKPGVHWDDERGANIDGTTASEVFDAFVVQQHPLMKDFRNRGWKYLDKMDDILPGGGSLGAGTYQGGASTASASAQTGFNHVHANRIEENTALPASNSNVPLSLATSQAVVPIVDQALVAHAIPSTATAILSAGPSVPTPTSSSPPTSSLGIPARMGTASCCSNERRHSISSDESDPLLLSPRVGSRLSTLSTPSAHTNKDACTSTAGSQAVGTSSCENTTSIALYAINSSLHHLKDTLTSHFVDPLKIVRAAVSHLTQQDNIPTEHQQFMITHFVMNPTTATVYNSLRDTDRAKFVANMYKYHNPQNPGPSSGSV